MTHRSWTTPLVLVAATLTTHAATAQCGPSWLYGLQSTEITQVVSAAAMWDPDGQGPQPEQLIIATRDSYRTSQCHIWNGESWATFGARFSGGIVQELVPTSLGLLASGTFTSNGSAMRGVARWNGTDWVQFCTPIPRSATPNSPPPAEYRGRIVVGATGPNAPVLESDGASWRVLAETNGGLGTILAQGDTLIVFGSFTRIAGVEAAGIARFDGHTWSPMTEGHESWARGLCFYNGQPIAVENGPDYNGWLTQWNGTRWVRLAPCSTEVYAGNQFQTDLIITGPFRITTPEGPADTIARWNGARFERMQRGISAELYSDWPHVPEALAVSSDSVFVGGNITISEPSRIDKIARWNGHQWCKVVSESSMTGPILDLEPFNLELIAAGSFTGLGATDINNIARWNGFAWNPLGGPLDGEATFLMPYDESNLLVGGAFTRAGEQPLNHIALWDGGAWRPFADGLNGPAYAAMLWHGDLIVGGAFTQAGGVPARNIARWDGSQWHAFTNGVDGAVYAIEAVGEDLYFGGDFINAGNTSSAYLTRWDGSAFRAFPLQPTNRVTCLLEDQGTLLVGGYFGITSGDLYISGLARWVPGQEWQSVDGVYGSVTSMKRHRDGILITGGQPFSQGINPMVAILGTDFAHYYPHWNDHASYVFAAAEFQGDLVAGGSFNTMPDGRVSTYFSRWAEDLAPRIAEGPVSISVPANTNAILSAAPVRGFAERLDTFRFQWLRNDLPVADGPGGASVGGGTVSGASGILTASRRLELRIDNTAHSDAGEYRLRLTNDCGQVLSDAATLTVDSAPCPADFNSDGFVDLFDYTSFVAAFEAGDTDPTPDFNADGFLDFFDYAEFVAAYEAGC